MLLPLLLDSSSSGLGGGDNTLLLLLVCGFAALAFLLINQKQNQQQQQQNAPQHQHQFSQQVAPAAPSAEVRALQDSVRMLIEAQSRAQMQPQQQQQQHAFALPPQMQQQSQWDWQNQQRSSRSVPITFNQGRDASPDPSHHDAAAAPSSTKAGSSNSSSMQLTRTPSFHATMAGGEGSSSGAVPFELLADMRNLQDSIKNLERKNRELNRQLTLTEVSNVVDVEAKYRMPVPLNSVDGTSKESLNLSASEIETIRAIFNMFDTEQTGTISTRELQSLHKQLGEPLTDDEASAAVSELDPEGTGSVTFMKFLIWWYHSHSQGKKGSAYTQRFKLMHAKLTAGNFDVDKVITQDSGEVYTLEYRLSFYYKGHNQSLRPISPWHDIPLNRIGSGEQGQLFNFVCEIPKWTRAKFECATGEAYNPIKQDTQHGKLRYYKHGDMMFNYGFFPQTWEDPEVIPLDTNCPGDNDPIDCVEIGATQIRVGAITAVKVLGLLGLIDDGETDWKIIAIAISDPMAHLLNDVDDVEEHLPGAIKAIREYFRDYKSFSGKINTYALRAQAMPRHYAMKVLEETHQHWKSLHLVKKRSVIGASHTQMDGWKAPEQSSQPNSLAVSAPASSPKSPKLVGAMPAKPAHVQPVSELTGVEQPMDRLMGGK